jgi:hypothetical protein
LPLSELADTLKAARQDMQQEAADELVGIERSSPSQLLVEKPGPGTEDTIAQNAEGK